MAPNSNSIFQGLSNDLADPIAELAKGISRGIQQKQHAELASELQQRETMAKRFEEIEKDQTYDTESRNMARDYAMQLRMLGPTDQRPKEFLPDKGFQKHLGVGGFAASPAWIRVTRRKVMKNGPAAPKEPQPPGDPSAMSQGPPELGLDVLSGGQAGAGGQGSGSGGGGQAEGSAGSAAPQSAQFGPPPPISDGGGGDAGTADDSRYDYVSTRMSPEDMARQDAQLANIKNAIPDDVADLLNVPRGTPMKAVQEVRLRHQADQKAASDAVRADLEKAKTLRELASIETDKVKAHALLKQADAHMESAHAAMESANAAMTRANRPDPMMLILGGGGTKPEAAHLPGFGGSGGPGDDVDDPMIRTTVNNRQYVDLTGYTGKVKNALKAKYDSQGIPALDSAEAEAVREIDAARLNQSSIANELWDKLPKDAAGRVLGGVSNTLEKVLQTDADLAAFSSWRSSAIGTLRATAGSKGLRINEAEILLAVANDLPQITDTVEVAIQKFRNIRAQLDNIETAHLVPRRANMHGSQGGSDLPTDLPPPPNVDLPPVSQRVAGVTKAKINGEERVWNGHGWARIGK